MCGGGQRGMSQDGRLAKYNDGLMDQPPALAETGVVVQLMYELQRREEGRTTLLRARLRVHCFSYLLEGFFLGERNWSSWGSWLFSAGHKVTA